VEMVTKKPEPQSEFIEIVEEVETDVENGVQDAEE